jgi:hypothetical protein
MEASKSSGAPLFQGKGMAVVITKPETKSIRKELPSPSYFFNRLLIIRLENEKILRYAPTRKRMMVKSISLASIINLIC